MPVPKKYLSLLRGINVGGNNKVAMKDLKKVFEDAGFTNVTTYINSGNIIFESPIKNVTEIVSIIETAIHKHFKFPVRVVVREAKTIKVVCDAIPEAWENDDEQKTDVLFLWNEYDKKDSLKLLAINSDVDTVIYNNGAIIWNVARKNYSKSGMNKFIGTELYKNMTARNVNTVRKLNKMVL